jgi:LysW-gamma-L-lysine carboxypeptidase
LPAQKSEPRAEPTFGDGQAEELLIGLLERYSPSGEEHTAADFMVKEMEALGFRASLDGVGNVVGELGDGERTILLLGHIDTVPGLIDVRREGSLLYGRGAVDAKGPLAAFVSAARRVGAQPNKRILVVGAVEEEAATSKGARYLLDRLSPEAVVIGEPSGWDGITVGYKGRLLADYALSREIGHTAGPDPSTCEEGVAFWQRIVGYAAQWNADRERMFDQLSPSLRHICSGEDGFAQRVSMVIGFRLPLGIDIDALEAHLVALAGEGALGFRGREEAFRASKSTPLARSFFRAIRSRGGPARFKVKSGTSDMNVVGPAWGCPIVAYGPGDSTLDHTPHEHIDLLDYHRAIGVLATVLVDL